MLMIDAPFRREGLNPGPLARPPARPHGPARWQRNDRPSLPRGQVAIHDHRHLAQYATASLQRLQSRIDRFNDAVDGLADVRDYKSLHRPLHRPSHPSLEKGLRLAVERGGFVEVAQQIDVKMP